MNPLATNHPISWIKKFHSDGALDLSPRFQRRPVWSDEQASYLIDSILNDLPIPEIFLRTSTNPQGDTRVEVVDGQQRLRSIIRFFMNDLELRGDHVSDAWQGVTWESLSSTQRETFWAFKIVVRELEGSSDPEVTDMFRRLNANQSNLNDQELRHSQLEGRFIKLVEELADDEWWFINRVVTPAQSRRMLDVEFIAELLIGLISGPLDKKKGLDEFFVDYDAELPDEEQWRKVFRRTRDLAESVVGGDLGGWRSKTEFYSLFLACGRVIADKSAPKGTELKKAIARLKAFRKRADLAKRKDRPDDVPAYVLDYAEAVTRASTDLQRRLYRISVVEALLLGETPKAAG